MSELIVHEQKHRSNHYQLGRLYFEIGSIQLSPPNVAGCTLGGEGMVSGFGGTEDTSCEELGCSKNHRMCESAGMIV
ncbi:hypothetical protein [Cupriavidus sp. DF5525]|uniref:hypothetical protein n=1 Tax=Cupriavidus sp. DF5525 TaxID=3160989 RepID=UPI0032DFCFCD